MARTIGAKDIIKRKIRKDRGKKRKKYSGREIIKFPKRRGDKTMLKLWVWEKHPMSREGRRRWNRRIRPYIKPFVYQFGNRIDAPVEMISTKEAIEDWALECIGYTGHFLIMGCSGSLRTKTGVKWVKLFRVLIRESPTGLKANMIQDHRMWRYKKWFWKG